VRQGTADSWVDAICARLIQLDRVQPHVLAWTTGLEAEVQGKGTINTACSRQEFSRNESG
jgi:hypothetical protein